jgi:integrase
MPRIKGPHKTQRLSAIAVRNIKTPGRYPDGNCLYLEVDDTGAKRWLLRIVVHGRRRDIGLGSTAHTSLADIRQIAGELRAVARNGGDPLTARPRAQKGSTFRAVSKRVFEEHKPTWRNDKHRYQWLRTVEVWAYPVVGDQPIGTIGRPDILRVLQPVWLKKPETARRLRQRLKFIFDWAKAHNLCTGDNPVEGVDKVLPRQTDEVEHMRALAIDDMPAFVAKLRAREADAITKLAFEFLILTAARTGEVINAYWNEVNLGAKTWTVPKERMKAGVEHVVPLAGRTLEILKELRKLTGENLLMFPARTGDKPISNMAFLMLLRRMKLDITAHGFRSTFRDWASERTNFPSEVVEMALAHTIANKVEAAYRRGNLLEKRRELMAAWSQFVCQTSAGRHRSRQSVAAE